MNEDLTPFLETWEFKPGQINVRKILGSDGREKIQMRVDLGVLQMESCGRPDGETPFGKESLLEYYEGMLKEHKFRTGTEEGFVLDQKDCLALQQEAVQYYHRYLGLFHLEDYDGVVRDTDRNLRLIDFITHYSDSEDVARAFQQFRPYLLMMNTRARTIRFLLEHKYDLAIKQVEWGISQIREWFFEAEREEMMQNSAELNFLTQWLEEVKQLRPLTPREKLQKALRLAIDREDYELAATIRDELNRIESTAKVHK